MRDKVCRTIFLQSALYLLAFSLWGILAAKAQDKPKQSAKKSTISAQQQAEITTFRAAQKKFLKLFRAQRFIEAESEAKTTLRLSRKILGQNHLITATQFNNMGVLYISLKRYKDAVPFLRASLKIRRGLLKKNDAKILPTLKDLKICYLVLGHIRKEKRVLDEILPFYDGTYGRKPQQLADSLNRSGVLQISLRDYQGARARLEKARKLYNELLGPEHLSSVMALSNLAVAVTKLKKYERAGKLFGEVYVARKKQLGADDEQTLQTLTELSEIASHVKDTKKAIVIGQQLVRIWGKKIGADHMKMAGKHNRLAAYAYRDKDYDLAGRSLARAVEITQKHEGKDSPQLLVYLFNLATLYEDHGRYVEAEALYAQRLIILEKTRGAKAPKTLNAMILLAKLNRQIARFEVSEKLFKTALRRERERPKPSKYRLGSLHNNMAGLYRELGRYGESAKQYKRAITVHRSDPKGKNADLARMYDNTGVLYAEMNLYDKAVGFHKKALILFEESLGPDHRSVALALNNLAAVYSTLYRNEEAVKLYERALTIYLKTARPADVFTGVLYDNLAGAYNKINEDKKAGVYYKKAMEALLLAFGHDHPEVALAMTNLAGVYTDKKDFDGARDLYLKAIEINEKAYGPKHPSLVYMWRLLGENAVHRKDDESAKRHFNKALIISINANGPDHSKTGFIHLKLAGRHLWERNYPLALASYREAARIEELEFSRKQGQGKVPQEGGRNSVFSGLAITTWHVARDEKMRLRLKEDQDKLMDEALYAAQRALRSSAGAALAQMSARFAAGSGALSKSVRQRQDLTRNYDRLDKKLLQLVSATAKKRDEAAITSARTVLARVDEQIIGLDKKLAKNFPEYASLANPKPLKTNEIQSLLQSDEALLYFMTSNQAVYIWAVTDNRLSWVRAPLKRRKLRETIVHLRKGLNPQSVGTRGFAVNKPAQNGPVQTSFDLKASHSLYKELLSPFKAVIEDKKHLIIVASDALTGLPFQVLLTDPPVLDGASESEAYQTASWLIKRHALTTLPSISSLKALRKFAGKGTRAGKPLIAFGDPIFSTGKQSVQIASKEKGVSRFFRGGRANLAALSQLSQLPATKDELINVAQTLNVPQDKVRLGREASEQAVKALDKSGELARHRIVYFATHGLISGDIKGLAEPALALSLPSSASALDDGLLTASEVTQLHLNADWVVLSACNTASADRPGAEALSGLARAFFYAGAKSLLVSHWPVYSNAATALTTRAFKIIETGQGSGKPVGRAQALRRSMLALINRKNDPLASHPSYWAPFVVVGEGAILTGSSEKP